MVLIAVKAYFSQFRKHCKVLSRLTLASLVLSVSAEAQEISVDESLTITDIQVTPSEDVAITFQESGDGYAQYVVESIVDLGGLVSTWDEVQEATIEALGNSAFLATFPYSDTDREFFRIVGIGTAGDDDGDGLNTAEEALLGTDANDPDSDDDGYSDGLEADQGTNPLDANDTPPFSSQPSVQFAASNTVVNEGDGEITLDLMIDPAYEGRVQIEISIMTNAEDGSSADFAIARSSVAVSGTTGSVTVGLVDDVEIENIESIIIDIVEDGTGNYQLGPRNQHILTVLDNDGFWTAVLRMDKREYQFRMRLLREDGETIGSIISSLDSDSELGRQGSGSIPEGEWPVTVNWLSESFEAESAPIPMNSNLLFEGVLNRVIEFSALPPDNPEDPDAPYIVEDAVIAGKVTDSLISEDPDFSYFNLEREGVFYLMKDIPVTEAIETPYELAE